MVDTNGDGIIQQSEAQAVTSLRLPGLSTINSFGGLEHFSNLSKLVIEIEFTDTLLLNTYSQLETFDLRSNSFSNVDFTNSNIRRLFLGDYFSYVSLPDDVDLTPLTNLEEFGIISGTLNSITFANPANIIALSIISPFPNLDLSTYPNLKELGLENYSGTSLDLTNNLLLEEIHLQDNPNLLNINGIALLSHLNTVRINTSIGLSSTSYPLNLQINGLSIENIIVWMCNSVTLTNLIDVDEVSLLNIATSIDINNIQSGQITTPWEIIPWARDSQIRIHSDNNLQPSVSVRNSFVEKISFNDFVQDSVDLSSNKLRPLRKAGDLIADQCFGFFVAFSL
jgi:hypothetical protein